MMFTRRSMISGVFALAFAVASVGHSGRVAAGEGGTDRPIKGFATGTITPVGGSFPMFDFVVDYEGKASHLGRFTRREWLRINVADGTLSGTMKFWAANGDELCVSFEGKLTSPTEATGSYTVTGGTGRFAGASGNARFSAVQMGLNVKVAFEGLISY